MEALRSLAARVRTNPWLAVGTAVAVLLVAAWIGWTIHVATDEGLNEGLGVLIAWPALLFAVALICLVFLGIYRLIRRLSATEQAD